MLERNQIFQTFLFFSIDRGLRALLIPIPDRIKVRFKRTIEGILYTVHIVWIHTPAVRNFYYTFVTHMSSVIYSMCYTAYRTIRLLYMCLSMYVY